MAAQNQPTQQQQPNNGPPAPPGGIGGGGGGNGGGNGNNPNNANPNGQNNGGAGAGAAGGVAGGVAGGAGAGAAAAAAAAVPPVATGPVSASGAVINPNVDTVQPDCIAWRPNPAGATDGGRWVLGCVQAAAGYQCGPAAAFSAVPTCSIKNWNPNCANQPWLLPRVGTVTERVPIYGCISEEAIPKGYLCPSTHDVMPSGTTDPAMLVSGNITTACTVGSLLLFLIIFAVSAVDLGDHSCDSINETVWRWWIFGWIGVCGGGGRLQQRWWHGSEHRHRHRDHVGCKYRAFPCAIPVAVARAVGALAAQCMIRQCLSFFVLLLSYSCV
ncbi:hypothetical protein BC828DRAFT_389316 [Blastocladiella britannica]|nr:hypothetical protein BC828DRAFT_389316 [Blastocladiella britannica]